MNFDDLKNKYTIINDEKGFRMPYRLYSDVDKEHLLQRYRELRPKNHPYLLRCKGLVYGLLGERGD